MFFDDLDIANNMFSIDSFKTIMPHILKQSIEYVVNNKKENMALLPDNTQKILYGFIQEDGNSEAIVFIDYISRFLDYIVSTNNEVDGIRLFYDYKASKFKMELIHLTDVIGLSYVLDIESSSDIKECVVFSIRKDNNTFNKKSILDYPSFCNVIVDDVTFGSFKCLLQFLDDNKEMMQLLLVVDKYRDRDGLYKLENDEIYIDPKTFKPTSGDSYKMLYVIKYGDFKVFRWSYIDESMSDSQYAKEDIAKKSLPVYYSYIESIIVNNTIKLNNENGDKKLLKV